MHGKGLPPAGRGDDAVFSIFASIILSTSFSVTKTCFGTCATPVVLSIGKPIGE
jgi:hypothetical protein